MHYLTIHFTVPCAHSGMGIAADKAMAADNPLVVSEARRVGERNPEHVFLPTTDNLSRGDEAFGLRKGDPDAPNFFSDRILVNTTNGWLAECHHYWFKTRDWEDQVDLQQ